MATSWLNGSPETVFAEPSDLPYALVTPGEWSFSDGGSYALSDPIMFSIGPNAGKWEYQYRFDGTTQYHSQMFDTEAEARSAMRLEFRYSPGSPVFKTATRASLPGYLLDRSVNAVSDEAALVLPPLENQGKSRDLLVRMTLTATTAVTVSASTGETVTWDSAGSPSDTYEAGTYLFRFTEVSQPSSTASVFHFDDLGNAAIDPAILAAKLDSTSAAPAFDATKTYSVGEYVTYEGGLYECTTAITTAGAWTGSTNWTARNMATPDATFDIMANGFARLVGADGTLLWQQGYDLNGTTSSSPADGGVNAYAFAANATAEVSLILPSVTAGKVGDFIIDVTNPALDSGASGYPSAFSDSSTYAVGDKVAYDSKIWRCTTAVSTAGAWTGSTNWELAYPYFSLPSTASFVTPRGMNISDMLSFAPGTMCELYFTLTSFAIGGKPTWKVARQDVEAVS